MKKKLAFYFFALILGLSIPQESLQAFTDTIPYVSPLEISYGPDPLQRFDLYRNNTLPAQPVAIIIHGGAWSFGDKRSVSTSLEFQTKLLYQRGFAVVSMNYRLAPQSIFPAAVDDVRSVVDWIINNGLSYGLKNEIIIASESAGSNIGGVVAVTDSRIKGIITIGLPAKLDDFSDDSYTGNAAGIYFGNGCRVSTCTVKAGQASPYWVATRSVPMLMINGELDTLIPYSQSNIMAVKNGSAYSAVIVVPGAGHYGVELNTLDVENAISYFADHVIGGRTFNSAQFISQSVPTNMVTSGNYPVSITLRNNGTTTWVPKNILGEYVLGPQNPQGNSTWGLSRVSLPVAVEPNQQATFNFSVTAPSSPGTYNFGWGMLQELVQWFGGNSTNVAVNVSSPVVIDTTPPIVSISSPISGSTVSGGSVNISANASDNVGVAGVQFRVDGTNIGPEDTTSPYLVTWNSTSVYDGSHNLTAIARDSSGNITASSNLFVTVSNTVTPPPPPPPTSFQRTIQIDIQGRSNREVTGTLTVLNSSRVQVRSFPITTNSSGLATVTFDIAPQLVYLKLNLAPFLTKIISLDLNTTSTYIFPRLLTGDIVQDNYINSVDYSALNSRWFTSDSTADLNRDGVVNTIDFSFINQNWLLSGDV